MRTRITKKKLRVVSIVLLFMSVIMSGCEKKTEEVKAEETVEIRTPDPVLEIPFVDVLDNYFFNGDTSDFSECIGKIVTAEEMAQVQKKYGENSFSMFFNGKRYFSIVSQEPRGVFFNKTILYTDEGIRRIDGLANSKILDIQVLESSKGSNLLTAKLYENAVGDSRNISEVKNYIGVMEYDLSMALPFDTKIKPKWIVTANEEGKISITEYKDEKVFMYFEGGPI